MFNTPIEYQMPDRKQEAIDKINKICYDNRADLWDRFPFPDALPQFVAKYYDPKLGNKVLDVGSGTGCLAQWLLDQGFDVQCIDPSAEMVRRCRNKGLKVEQSTIQDYVPQEQFGMIFAILSLIHVPKSDFEAQLQKTAKAMPQGGLLFLGLLEGSGEGISEESSFPRFFSFYKPLEVAEYSKLLFDQIDYYYVKNGVGYMLFVLKKK